MSWTLVCDVVVSVTVTVKVAVPAAVGVPVNVPFGNREMPAGVDPDVTANE